MAAAWTPEKREQQRRRALKLVAEGKFGGSRPNSGRRKKSDRLDPARQAEARSALESMKAWLNVEAAWASLPYSHLIHEREMALLLRDIALTKLKLDESDPVSFLSAFCRILEETGSLDMPSQQSIQQSQRLLELLGEPTLASPAEEPVETEERPELVRYRTDVGGFAYRELTADEIQRREDKEQKRLQRQQRRQARQDRHERARALHAEQERLQQLAATEARARAAEEQEARREMIQQQEREQRERAFLTPRVSAANHDRYRYV